MPEGDTVYRHAQELRATLLGDAVAHVLVKGLEQPALRGRAVESVEARGKHLLVGFAGGVTLRIHLGIAGRWRSTPRSAGGPVNVRTARLASASAVILTARFEHVCRSARTVELLRTAFLRDDRALASLGPDLLGETCDLDEVVRRAGAPGQRGRPIAEVLLDQRVAAGLGNVYKCELLFLHRLNPFRDASTVPEATLRRLYEDGRDLLRANLGPWRRTTTADRSRGALPARGRGRHYVYGRARRACYTCGAPIAVTTSGDDNRPTYFCPTCQR